MVKAGAYKGLLRTLRLSGFTLMVAFLVSSFTLGQCRPAAAGANHQHHISTEYATIHYSGPKVIADFTAILSRAELNPRFADSNGLSVDRIVFRVRNILGIHTPGFHFNIYLLDSAEDLKAIHAELGLKGKVPVAFYSRSTGSVFLSMQSLNDGILAHEVAHAVINSHYTPPLPTRMQEILAQFVDKNLWVDRIF